MSEKDFIWAIKIDWLNVLSELEMSSINEIPEYKRQKAIKSITKIFGTEELLSFKPKKIDKIVANELKELMKKELISRKRQEDKLQDQINSNIIPLKDGGIMRININDLKDLNLDGNPEDIVKYFYKKFLNKDKDKDNKDDDKDKVQEDNTGYYI